MKMFIRKSVIALARLGLTTTASAKGYKEVKVSNGGSFVGTVAAGPAEAAPRSYTISKDTKICGDGTRTVNFVEINDAGMLMNAVVFLVDVDEGKAFDPAMINLCRDQKGCEFSTALGMVAIWVN